MSKDFYFKHDYNASRDQKLARLLRVKGSAGYGLFWRIVELLYTRGGEIDNDHEQLAYDLREDLALVTEVLERFDLFYVQDGKIRSGRADREFQEREEAKEKFRALGSKGGTNRAINQGQNLKRDSSARLSEGQAYAQAKSSIRGEERRGKEITTANDQTPTAVEESKDPIRTATDALEAKRINGLLSTMKLPFSFGAPGSDRFEKGFPIVELPKDTAKAILERMPRLGSDVRAVIKARIAQFQADMTPGQQRRAERDNGPPEQEL